MRDGRVLQVDTPQRLYQEPLDLFVAAFIGTPAMNLVEATLDGDEVAFGQYRVPLAPGRRPAGFQGRVVLGIRPESFEDGDFAPAGSPRIDVSVSVLEELGSDAHVFFPVDAPRVTSEMLEAAEQDSTLIVQRQALFNARVDPRTTARVGGPLRLAVDPARFHFFDPETGASLVAAPPLAREHEAAREEDLAAAGR
jgi:multiple sugar transport system ATP-binding protein